jgi:CDP-paratose 2-epimerase
VKVLVTGGCGFIGTNIVRRHLSKGDSVIIIDNLSRKGSHINAEWSKDKGVEFYQAPIESGIMDLVTRKHPDIDIVYHMAAQVAVTLSIENPLHDAEVNIYGTLRVLEAVRKNIPKAFVIYASTNKVYGSMEYVNVIEEGNRYRYNNGKLGISETRGIDFHSPYGCSKGAADQYVRDYSRIYGLDTVVFRQSCIYGTYQSGHEDQGWLSWFCQKVLKDETINIYGNGKQVRDVLYIDDLMDLFDIAYEKRHISRGKIYNIGGGPSNTLSLLELISILEGISGKKIKYEFHKWRSGDQKVYISDIFEAKRELGWEPVVAPLAGVMKLYEWTKSIV